MTHADSTVGEVDYVWGKDISGRRNGAAGIGGFLYLKRNGTVYIPYADAYGNILGYWDANGNLVASYTYNAFGKTIAQDGAMADAFAFRYSTKYFDDESGLYYYGYRYYDPTLMHWLTTDPLEEEGGMNLYEFCKNNSLSGYDLLGLTAQMDGWVRIGQSIELHVWNCSEWPTLTDHKPGGTQAKYVAHFKKYTFKRDLKVPADYISYFTYGIVSLLKMTDDPNVYWCMTLKPLNLYKKCVGKKVKYKIKFKVGRLDKHPKLSDSPEEHITELEGKVFEYGPK